LSESGIGEQGSLAGHRNFEIRVVNRASA
jgi:hypothetical protein